MKKITELKKNHVFLLSLSVLVAHDLLTTILASVINHFLPLDRSTNLFYMIIEIIVFLVALFLLLITSQKHVLKQGGKGFFKSLWSGMVILVLVLIGCLGFMMESTNNNVTFKSSLEIWSFVLFVLLVGLAEEFLYRGIITDSILQRFGHTPGGIVFSVISSAVLFGLFHFLNILSGQSLPETIIQVIATSMLGCLLGAIYVRHKNIYAVVLLHALLDYMVMQESGLVAGNSIQYENIVYEFIPRLIQAIKSQSIFVIAAIVVLRPKILKQLTKESR